MVVAVLKGDLRPVRSYLEQEMQRAAGELKFELAQRYKQRLDALDNYAGKSVIVSAKIVDVDVFFRCFRTTMWPIAISCVSATGRSWAFIP